MADTRLRDVVDLPSADDGPWDHRASDSHVPDAAPGASERSLGEDSIQGVKWNSSGLRGAKLGTGGHAGAAGEGPGWGGGFLIPARPRARWSAARGRTLPRSSPPSNAEGFSRDAFYRSDSAAIVSHRYLYTALHNVALVTVA